MHVTSFVYRLTVPKVKNPNCNRITVHPMTSVLGLLTMASMCSFRNETDYLEPKILYDADCGIGRQPGIYGIYGGTGVTLEEFPWMAQVGWKMKKKVTKEDMYFPCGGALISDHYVLTAAHCVVKTGDTGQVPTDVTLFKVRLGAVDIRPTYLLEKYSKIFDVEILAPHDGYNNITQENDIALLKLHEKVLFNAYIRPICLPLEDYRSASLTVEKAVVAGWGKTENVKSSPTLLKVEIGVMDLSQCKWVFEGETRNVVDEKVICAGGVTNKDSCEGDSGGPLMWKPKDRWILVGVVSWGLGDTCGLEGYPGVYTRISYFVDWILENIKL